MLPGKKIGHLYFSGLLKIPSYVFCFYLVDFYCILRESFLFEFSQILIDLVYCLKHLAILVNTFEANFVLIRWNTIMPQRYHITRFSLLLFYNRCCVLNSSKLNIATFCIYIYDFWGTLFQHLRIIEQLESQNHYFHSYCSAGWWLGCSCGKTVMKSFFDIFSRKQKN